MQHHFVVNNSEISTLFVVELLPLRICQQLISMNHKVWKNKCNPAMQTKKIGDPAATYWYNLSLNKLELFCFFCSTLFFLQNGSVEERCLQKERSHVLIYNMLNFCVGLPFCSCLQHACPPVPVAASFLAVCLLLPASTATTSIGCRDTTA